jgi:hypothetical protein
VVQQAAEPVELRLVAPTRAMRQGRLLTSQHWRWGGGYHGPVRIASTLPRLHERADNTPCHIVGHEDWNRPKVGF